MPEVDSLSGSETPLVQPFAPVSQGTGFPVKMLIGALLIVILGAASGFLVYRSRGGTVEAPALLGDSTAGPVKMVNSTTEEGVVNSTNFTDTATGMLQVNDGKITKEGSHVLIRKEGDPSQNAYLTSTVVDLDKFVGKKVQVWGQTFQGQKAGWLMDVGRIKVVN